MATDEMGLPDHLPPLRLPPEAELAAAARDSGLLRHARELASWVGDRRPLADDGGGLRDADVIAAAQALDVPVPELALLWQLAVDVELVSVEGTVATSAADRWPSGDDDADLDAWLAGLGLTLASMTYDADLAGEEHLAFDAIGVVGIMLFLTRHLGMPRAELAEMARDAATAGAPPAQAKKAWESWVTAHGHPVDTLLGRLAKHGAAGFDDDTARFTPLALWAIREQLVAGGTDVPLLPPAAEMSATELVAAASWMDEEESAAETQSWLAFRTPEAAVAELLEAATAAAPAGRLFATNVVGQLGTVAEPRWRAALDRPELRAYAKLALSELAGEQPPAFAPGLEPVSDDLAWLLTDVLAASADAFDDDELDEQVRSAVPHGQEQAVFDIMWRIPHPAVRDVLTMLGTRHPDKKVAKAARKAAFKASSR